MKCKQKGQLSEHLLSVIQKIKETKNGQSSKTKKGTAERALTLTCHPKIQEKQTEKSVFAQEIKQLSERALTICKSSKNSAERKGVSFQTMNCQQKGPLSGHLPPVNHPDIHRKAKESAFKNTVRAKGTAEWALTSCKQSKESAKRKASGFKCEQKGQLSGHLHPGFVGTHTNPSVIQHSRKKSKSVLERHVTSTRFETTQTSEQ